tara:strand:- start:23810 stop:24433 length:624 start_codon:yes stop_codon:yes gene_type:complete
MALLNSDTFSNSLDSILFKIAMEEDPKMHNEFVTLLYEFEQDWGKGTPKKETKFPSSLIQTASKLINTSPRNTKNAWYYFNNFMDKVFQYIDPITYFATYKEGTQYDYYLNKAGLYKRVDGVTEMKGSDGVVLATGLTTDAEWESAWNTIKIPYDKTKDVYPVYIKATGISGIFRIGNARLDSSEMNVNATTGTIWSYNGPTRCKDC